MTAGDVFLQLDNKREPKHHSWVIISDPEQDAESILLVNFTDADYWPDDACEIAPGEHACVTKKTRVAYSRAEVKSLRELRQKAELGLLAPQGRVSPALLLRIRLGAWDSIYIAYEHQDRLEEQCLGRDDLLEG